MKTLHSATLIAFALILLAVPAVAVDQDGGIRLLLGSPTGEFDENVDNMGYGLELTYGLRPSSAWTFGVGMNFMIYGSETREFELPLVEDFEMDTENNLAGGFLFAQFRPLAGAVQPYAEGRVGMNYLWTESSLKDEDWWDGDEVARQTNYDDFASFWGAGGGVLFRLSEGNKDEGKPGVFLDVKVNHVQGAKAEYLTEGDVEIINDKPVFSPQQSETHFTNYQVGVTLTF